MNYDDIRQRSKKIYELNLGVFLTERHYFGQLAELILNPLEVADKTWDTHATWPDDVKTAAIVACARMYSDFEAAQSLILQGLADQAYMSLRDSVECMMLTRLFRLSPDRAGDWLYRLKLYPATQVRQWLIEAGDTPVEYGFYDYFSKRSHANLVGSAHRLIESDAAEGEPLIRTIKFGADAEKIMAATTYTLLLGMMYLAVSVVLPPLYRLFLEQSKEWRSNVKTVGSALKKLDLKLLWPLVSGSEPADEEALTEWHKDMIDRKSGSKRLMGVLTDLERG